MMCVSEGGLLVKVMVRFFALFVFVVSTASLAMEEVVKVTESGVATLGDGTKGQVKEKAKSDAIRKAVELVSGVEIVSSSEVNNFELVSDVVKTYTAAYVKSIKELSYSYDPAREEGVYEGEFLIDKKGASMMASYDNKEKSRKKSDISASFFFFNQRGAVIEDASVVRSGDQFNIFIQPSSDMFVNIINRDSRGNMFRVFPNKAVTSEENPLRAGAKYYFPPKNSELTFAFDDVAGSEAFYFVLSDAPMADLDALFERLGSAQSENQRADINNAVEARIKTRGIALSTTSGKKIATTNSNQDKSQKRLVEKLEGKGAVVKVVNLHHVN